MATYVLPQVLVYQDLQTISQAQANPLPAHITGPHAQLIRYADDDERDLGYLGYYDDLQDTAYAWPHRPAGGVVDQPYTKLWIKDALLRYLERNSGNGGDFVKSARNAVTSSTFNLATEGEFERDALLLDRDVALGDVVKLRFVPDAGDPVILWSYVKAFVGTTVAATVDTVQLDEDNSATTSANATVTKVGGPVNAITATASGAAYNAYKTGVTEETYTVIVTASSTGGDFTTATLRVISASGLDDDASVTPSAEGVATAIGALGATITFDDAGGADESESAVDLGYSPNDLIAGQRWQVVVRGVHAVTAVPTTNATYTGDVDTSYIVEVTKGNKFADGPAQVSVTTLHGTDISGPTNVAAAATAIAIGTEGTTITFAGVGLTKGDRFYVPVTAATTGALRTLVIGHNISEDIDDDTPVDVTFFIRKPDLEVSANRTGFAPVTNFDQSETEITVNAGIVAYDATYTDDGEPVALDVVAEVSKNYGKLYVEYRAWLTTLCNEVNGIIDVGLLNDQISGPLDPDNPLKWAVFKALENCGGRTTVKYTAVCDPDDVDSWTNVLELLLGRDDVYGLVPLTRDRTIQDLWAAHCSNESSPEQGLWRVAWFNLAGIPEIPIVHAGSTVASHTEATTEDGEVCLCVVADDPDTSGTQYTYLRCPAGNGNFITNGVRAGDIVRTQYTGDGFGNYTYSEYVVDDVQTEDQIRLLAGPGVAINVAAKTEIWRNLTATEEAAAIGVTAGSWASRRVRAVWPDRIESSGTIQEGYHLCAALAGLTSGVAPHQGLTNLEILGFSDVARTTAKFNRPQLDQMAGSGVWIVTQDPQTGAIYSRHAVTTGAYDDINQREEMLTRNVDSISYRFKDHFKPFIGVTNVTPSMIALLRLETDGLVNVLKTEKFTRELGGQLIDATIVELRQHALLKDRVVLILDCEVPYALNNFEVHLVV